MITLITHVKFTYSCKICSPSSSKPEKVCFLSIYTYHFFSSMYCSPTNFSFMQVMQKIFNMFSFYLVFQMQEVADCNCVYRNVVHHSAGERTQILHDVASDPTLPRTKTMRCTKCNHPEVVFFQVINFTSLENAQFCCS